MFNEDIIEPAKRKTSFREVVATGLPSQVVVTSIPAGGDIGVETHAAVDQTLVFVAGDGTAILEGGSPR